MDYKDVRLKFCEISGRYDLITATYEDNGADFFLNAGQKYLDRFFDSGKAIARYPVIVAAGTYVVRSLGIRAIKEVWIADSSGKSQLEKTSIMVLNDYYSEGFYNADQGTPGFYAPALLRPFPDTLAAVTGMYGVDELLLSSTHYTYNGVVIMPPPDQAYTVEIVGLFYSPDLSATLSGAVWTQTKSYWTEVHPEVLIEAAIYKLHSLYLNTSGAADYKASVLEDITGILADGTEEDLAGNMQMGG